MDKAMITGYSYDVRGNNFRFLDTSSCYPSENPRFYARGIPVFAIYELFVLATNYLSCPSKFTVSIYVHVD